MSLHQLAWNIFWCPKQTISLMVIHISSVDSVQVDWLSSSSQNSSSSTALLGVAGHGNIPMSFCYVENTHNKPVHHPVER